MVSEENFYSRTLLLHHMVEYLSVLGNLLPYMGANLWYVSLWAEIYTHKHDICRAGQLSIVL